MSRACSASLARSTCSYRAYLPASRSTRIWYAVWPWAASCWARPASTPRCAARMPACAASTPACAADNWLAVPVLVIGTFVAQAVAPAFVNVTAETAKGGASALYLTSYYVGGTLGAALPGLAFQATGWPGVVGACVAATVVAMLANALLCGRMPRGRPAR